MGSEGLATGADVKTKTSEQQARGMQKASAAFRDPDLVVVVDRWPSLASETRAAIVRLATGDVALETRPKTLGADQVAPERLQTRISATVAAAEIADDPYDPLSIHRARAMLLRACGKGDIETVVVDGHRELVRQSFEAWAWRQFGRPDFRR